VQGLDLSKPISEKLYEELKRALAEHIVIFFRDQHLSPQQHLDFGRLWGNLHVHPAKPHEPGFPELLSVKSGRDTVRVNGEDWHSDVSCDEEPPMGSILYITTCPPEGGDTLFSNMYAAYESLSEPMKQYLNGLQAVHDAEEFYRSLYANDSKGMKDVGAYPSATHPVIRTHPWTKKKLIFVNRVFTREIVGVPREEGRAILEFLLAHVENPLYQCRFRWRANSIAFWDNRSAQHRALWDYWPNERYGNRVTVIGDKPY